MITIQDIREKLYGASGKTSEIVRQLAFAGIAVIWIFNEQENGIQLPKELIWPLKLIVLGLFFDFLQYLSRTIVFGVYNLYKEDRVKPDEEFNIHPLLNTPALLLFGAKVIAISMAYYELLTFLNEKIIG